MQHFAPDPASQHTWPPRHVHLQVYGVYGWWFMGGTPPDLGNWIFTYGEIPLRCSRMEEIPAGQPAWLSISAEITPAYWRIPMAAASQSLFVVGEMYHGLRSWRISGRHIRSSDAEHGAGSEHGWNPVVAILLWLVKVVTGTWILFFHILGIIIPTDFHIFQRGWNHQPDGLIPFFLWNITMSHHIHLWFDRPWLVPVRQVYLLSVDDGWSQYAGAKNGWQNGP